MIGRVLFILTIVSNYVLSLPVTPSHLESEDVKVMKCIVEALTDVLSRPHPLPVSQECLEVLRTDDRLVSILRHRSFLKELQDIAVQGANERARQHGDIIAASHVTQSPQSTDDVADQSMLEALGGPGERSILTQKRRTEGEEGESLRDEESQESSEIQGEEEEQREEEGPGTHISDSMNNWSEAEVEKRVAEEEAGEEEEDDEEEGKQASSEENSLEGFEEGNVTKDKKGDKSTEKRHTPEKKTKEKTVVEEEERDEEEEKRSLFLRDSAKSTREGGEEEDGGEMKRERWTKRAKGSLVMKRAGEKEAQESQEEKEKEKRAGEREAQESQEEKEKEKRAGEREAQESQEEKEKEKRAGEKEAQESQEEKEKVMKRAGEREAQESQEEKEKEKRAGEREAQESQEEKEKEKRAGEREAQESQEEKEKEKRAGEREAQESQEEKEKAMSQWEVLTRGEEDQRQRSPEVKELQMIARRAPEESRGGVEEEGSASRKSEEPEIESLAAIESELENVAQKLHELRRG